MTVETTTARVTYTGAGTTGPFSVPFYFLEDDDLTVIKTTIADGTETTLVLTTDYTVSGAADEAGGSVTLTASLSSAYKLTIIRDPDLLQSSDYPPNDKFPATTHERVVDKLTMIAQRLKDLINRSFRLSDGDVSGVSLSLSNLSASKLIAVNSAGTALEAVSAADVGLTPVSAFAATLLDDADAAAARATLGAAALSANTFTGLQTFAAGADIASATTVDLTAATGNLVRITGTTATTGVTINNGQVVLCYPTGAWPLTYHATTMPIKGGASYTCAAGDTVIFTKDVNGSLHVDIFKADGTALVGTETAWTDYSATSTIVGWSSYTTKQIYYKDIGKTRFVTFTLYGTSNSTSTTFTVPSASSNTVATNNGIRVIDNGVEGPIGLMGLPENSSTVTCYRSQLAAWTNSGVKLVSGQFTYQLP